MNSTLPVWLSFAGTCVTVIGGVVIAIIANKRYSVSDKQRQKTIEKTDEIHEDTQAIKNGNGPVPPH